MQQADMTAAENRRAGIGVIAMPLQINENAVRGYYRQKNAKISSATWRREGEAIINTLYNKIYMKNEIIINEW